jgi:hypothetical protein
LRRSKFAYFRDVPRGTPVALRGRMKKTPKKLHLDRETLRRLSTNRLRSAHGGYLVVGGGSADSHCLDSGCVQCPLWSADGNCDTTLTHTCPIKKIG